MRTLFVLNDPAYGTERSYNGLRLANALAKRDTEEVRVFLMADAVSCALAGQQTPNGYYNPSAARLGGPGAAECGLQELHGRTRDRRGWPAEGTRRSSLTSSPTDRLADKASRSQRCRRAGVPRR
jgi:sulfur relay (sulfurtransferase) complex TusBCD TusD component (DsrE family)